MIRTYMPMIDNGLFVAEYYLNIPYRDITIDVLYDNISLFSGKIVELIETEEFYRKITYSTHVNSSFTQRSTKKTKGELIKDQQENLLGNVRGDKNCLYCGQKQVNTDLNIDRKYMYGLVSQTFYNSANNLQTVDVCPVCAYLSMLSILNIQKIGMPTLYISDSDNFMRKITGYIQNLSIGELDIDSNLKATELVNKSLLIDETPGYITQFCFQNAGQIVNDVERTFYSEDIKLLKKLEKEELLDEFIGFGLHNNLAFDRLLIADVIYCSPKLLKILGEFELKEKEKKVVEYATKTLLEIENLEKILKELKLCNTKNKFNNFILEYSEKKALVEDVKDYDLLTGYNWYKYRDYINMNVLIYKDKEVTAND